jgi:hypothetical protein
VRVKSENIGVDGSTSTIFCSGITFIPLASSLV